MLGLCGLTGALCLCLLHPGHAARSSGLVVVFPGCNLAFLERPSLAYGCSLLVLVASGTCCERLWLAYCLPGSPSCILRDLACCKPVAVSVCVCCFQEFRKEACGLSAPACCLPGLAPALGEVLACSVASVAAYRGGSSPLLCSRDLFGFCSPVELCVSSCVVGKKAGIWLLVRGRVSLSPYL